MKDYVYCPVLAPNPWDISDDTPQLVVYVSPLDAFQREDCLPDHYKDWDQDGWDFMKSIRGEGTSDSTFEFKDDVVALEAFIAHPSFSRDGDFDELCEYPDLLATVESLKTALGQ